jgi:ATP-dependent helicase Lhr and Lhr-like helicase
VNLLDRNPPLLPELFTSWFASRGWTPRPHQLELLAKAHGGRSALLIAPTGGGKTLAGFLPSLVELSTPYLCPHAGRGRHTEGVAGEGASRFLPDRKTPSPGSDLRSSPPPPRPRGEEYGLHTLYISPLKALAVDVARNLEIPVAEMHLPIRIETRTGDTPASKRQRQRRHPPHMLLTTPEQLALLLASADAPYLFGTLHRVVLDELHALVTSKRGDLLSLGLARLFRIVPELTSIGLSATVAEPDDLCRFMVPQRDGPAARGRLHFLARSRRRLG